MVPFLPRFLLANQFISLALKAWRVRLELHPFHESILLLLCKQRHANRVHAIIPIGLLLITILNLEFLSIRNPIPIKIYSKAMEWMWL